MNSVTSFLTSCGLNTETAGLFTAAEAAGGEKPLGNRITLLDDWTINYLSRPYLANPLLNRDPA